MNPSAEKRHFTRIPFDARYVLNDSSAPQQWEGEVLDISLKGALLHNAHSELFAPGEAYRLQVSLDGGDLTIHMDVTVAHVETDRLGVHCDYIDLDSATHLRRILELNLADQGLLERELAEMIDSH